MPCRDCIVSMKLQVGEFSHYGPCDSCGNMQDNYTVTDSHNVLDLSDTEKTLLMGIDRNRVKFTPKNEFYLVSLGNMGLIKLEDRPKLTKKGIQWLWYLTDHDHEAYTFWMKLRIRV